MDGGSAAPASAHRGRPGARRLHDAFEIICCDCGDHPDLDYRDVSPELQRIRGPYPIVAGVAAYEQHLDLHHPPPARVPVTAAMTDTTASRAAAAARAMILPLALAQFIASYAATNMNVAISAIAKDLGTTVGGVQTAITLFTLTMAALMIPGSKLTDIWGRKRCFIIGLAVYGVGGLLAALAQGLPLLIVGYSLLEGVGSALMIPPIYILVTVTSPTSSRGPGTFFLHIRSAERKGRDVLLPLRLFRNKIANLGLGTQTIQWLILQGSFFTVSVYLQEVNGYNAIQTGLMLTPATIGILAASAGADRFARRHPQRWLIVAGFLATAAGMILLLALVRAHSGIWTWIPGLLLFGAGVGVMLTSSVNVVQSSFPDADQGEISGLSRSVSNLGSSLGTALVGSVLVAVALPKGQPFAVALTIMLVVTLIGLVLAVLIPRQPIQASESSDSAAGPVTRPTAR